MRPSALRVALALMLAFWGAAPARAQATPELDATYQQKFAEAVAEYQLGNWAEARALFLQAHALNPNARTLRTLGMTAFELRDYASALRELSAALGHPQRPLDARLQAEVQALVDRAWAFVGRFHVRVDPPSAALFVDDQPAQFEADGSLVLGLGGHTLRAVAGGYVAAQRTLRVQGHEDLAIDVKLDAEAQAPAIAAPARAEGIAPAAPNVHARTWTWVAAAGAVAFGGAALGLRLAGDAELDDLQNACGGAHRCKPGEPDETTLHTLDALTTASAITAGVAAVAAVALFFAEDARPEARARLVVDRATPTLVYRF